MYIVLPTVYSPLLDVVHMLSVFNIFIVLLRGNTILILDYFCMLIQLYKMQIATYSCDFLQLCQ